MAKLNFDQLTTVLNRDDSERGDRQVSFFSIGDGEEAIVRFPYSSTNDFDVISTHKIKVGDKERRISCLRDTPSESIDNCPLCAHGRTFQGTFAQVDSSKVESRFFVKLINYVKDDSGNIVPVACTWERPLGFARELVTLMQEYGPLSECIFKIKRTGKKLDTKYTIMFGSPAVYPEERYPKNFESFNNYNILGGLVLNKNYNEVATYLETGSFPQTATQEASNSYTNLDNVVDDSPMPVENVVPPMNNVTTQNNSTPPWEQNQPAVQRPNRRYY